MKKNKFIGIDSSKGYYCLYLFPLGFEILLYEGIQFSLIIWPIEINLEFKKNNTLFRMDD